MIRYTMWQKLYLALQAGISKVMIGKNIRICRFPFYIINKKKVAFGKYFSAGGGLRIEALGQTNAILVRFGNTVNIGRNFHLAAHHSVTIGNDVLIGSNVLITDHNHGVYDRISEGSTPDSLVSRRTLDGKPVVIGDNVWIGDGVVVLPGVTIGDNAIIGANAVVTKSIPKNTIAVGLPAKPVKRFNKMSEQWERIKK